MQAALIAKDSDTDALKDWEETLWQTDPENPDSDGDGTPDGEEVAERRNPLLAGPDDAIDEAVIASSTQSTTDLSETERLARSIFTQYLESGGQGGIVTSEAAAQLILPNLLRLQGSDATKISATYTWDDVVGVPETDTSLHAYGNNVGGVFKGKATENNNEILALMQFAQTGDPASMKSLESVIVAYMSRIATLRAIPVPESLVSVHVILLNALVDIHDGLIGFSKLTSDPIQTLLTITRYRAGTDTMASSLQAIAAYLIEHDITFAQSEDGARLIYAAQQ
ncbi:hypothetical protein L0Y40_00125 [Candidatus Wolfebacteria bacterium]|nr:hypothetical protein [Candidatus Wolfebacteria bacterium]